jgi:UDP-galactopyranose mutase
MPKEGYTKMIDNILDHPNIKVQLNTTFVKNMESDYEHIFNSMPIDEYYDYCYGELPYRSIKFENINIPMTKVLPSTVVNFTHKGPNTRVTEWKNIPNHGINETHTTLTFETPCDYIENNMQRFYPVKDLVGKNRDLYKKYHLLPNNKTTFIGRLGMYVYIDMDQCINNSLNEIKKYIKANGLNK